MQLDPKSIIEEVLNIIDFEDDKDFYAEEFIKDCERLALAHVLSELPEDKKKEFTQRIQKIDVGADQQRQKEIIAEYVAPEQYKGALQQATQTTFEGLMKEIKPTLSNTQTDKLQSYLKSFTAVTAEN